MQILKKRLAVVAAIGAALLILPAAGQAAQIFGSSLEHEPNQQDCKELGPCTIAANVEVPAEGQLTSAGAPSAGVITSLRIRAAVEAPTQVTFRVAAVTPIGMNPISAMATAAGTGPTVTLQTASKESPPQQFPARLAVKKGQHLAVDGTGLEATYDSSGSKFSYAFAPPLVDGTATASTEFLGELLVQATLEPDADGDGFGDETQDRCPSQATTQGACDRTGPGVTGLAVSGGRIAYRLSEAATVRFQLAQKATGRKLHGKCVAPTAANRSKPSCVRFKAIGHGFGGPGMAGPNKLALPNGRRLAPGAYRLTLTARDRAGNTTTRATSFRIGRK
jgi:hypothetical protein